MLSSNEQGLDIEEGELEAEGLQSGEEDGRDLVFDVAGVETDLAHHLHALGRNVGTRSEMKSRVEQVTVLPVGWSRGREGRV